MKKGLFLLLFLAILILPSVIAANCGDIITQNTNLSNDLYNCPNRGLEIGADNIVLDCNNYVINGTFSGPSAGHGIFLQGYSNVTIKNCQINNFLNGLFIDNSNGGILKNNNLDYNIRSGAYLRNSNNYEITNNSFIYNGDRNFINGYDSGIYVKDYSANNLIKNNYFFDNTNGIILESISSENYIEDNYIDRSPKNGILLRGNIGSNSNVSIEDNTILRNENGINLTYVRYVDLKNNIISNHSLTGIWSISSMDVFIENNSLINNNYGLFFHQQGSGNIFYHNNFISNIQSFYSTGLENITLDFNGEGNYWSDYDTVGEGCVDNNSNGICDSPYMTGSQIDNFPFVGVNGWQEITEYYFDNSDSNFFKIFGRWKNYDYVNSYNGNLRYIKKGIGVGSVGWRVSNTVIPRSYDVYVWKFEHPLQSRSATNAKYSVTDVNGTFGWFEVNQSSPGNEWILIGNYYFDNSSPQGVTLNDDADGIVIADAIKLVAV